MTPHIHHRQERSDHFGDVLFWQDTPRGKFRVIICRDGIQWAVQRRTGGARGKATGRWRTEGYMTTRRALISLWQAKTGTHPTGLRVFPERIAQATPSPELRSTQNEH